MGKSGSPVQPMQIDSRPFGKSQSVSAAPAYPERMRDTHVVRWYVLVLPSCHKGPAKGLQEELERRRRNGEPSFEYFAPSYVEVKKRDGRFVETRRPLLYNYVFIHASEHEIYRMKQWLPLYNFLPRIKDGKCEYHPYLSEEAMTNLQWVADSYSNVIPVYTPQPEQLIKGDRIRITEGRFKGAEASVIIQPGAGKRDIMVCVENYMWVPLLRVQPGQYEVIALNDDGKHVYTRLGNDRQLLKLHEALGRFHRPGDGVTEADRKLAAETVQQYGSLRMDSDIMRSKLYAMLLPAYTITGNRQESEKLIGTLRAMLPLVKAEQSRALLLTTLYGCTNSCLYHTQAHEIIDKWRQEENPKKSKQQLIRRLEDYDRWLGH